MNHLRDALAAVRDNAFRSLLSMLGVAIGVATVIALVSITQGLSQAVRSDFEVLGANSLTVRAYTSFEEQLQGKRNRLRIADYERLQRVIGSDARLTPVLLPFGPFGTQISAGNRATSSRVEAVSADMQETYNLFVSAGRFFTDDDLATRRRVCVLGEAVLERLGLGRRSIGEYLKIDSEWFKVVGVMEARGDLFGFSQDDYVLIPFSTGVAMFPDESTQDLTMILNVPNASALEDVRTMAENTLRQASDRRTAGGEDAFKVETAEQLSKTLSALSNVVTYGLLAIVSVSLLVAGIGIMNIMLVSVRERTREIGILKALGARRRDLLAQFLLEAVLLSSLGGLLGIGLGWAMAHAAALLLPGFPAPLTPLWVIATAFGFALTVGGVFGVVPAAQAANLHPVDALKHVS